MDEAPHISIVVLNWNGFADTCEGVRSVQALNYPSWTLFLVDNASGPAEVRALKERFEGVENILLILNDENLGFGKAHNRIFERLHREGHRWVACLNNDAIADPGWLKAMVERAKGEGCAMVASKMLAATNDTLMDNAGHFMLNTGEIIPKGFADAAGNYNTAEKTLGPCAGACLYDLEMLDRLGGFDEHFFVGYEDAELGLRAWLAGYDCFYEPQAVVRHKISSSLNKVRSADYLATIQENIFYTWFKLMPRAVIYRNLPAFVLKYMAVLFIDVVLLRFRFLYVMWSGLAAAFHQRNVIREARKGFYSQVHIQRSRKEISHLLVFFLWFDIQRFWQFIVLRKKSNLEV